MKKEQIKESTNKKINQIIDLARLLKIEISAKQMITDKGTIENIVYFIDTEEYPEESKIDGEPELKNDSPSSEEESEQIKNDEPTTV